MSDAECIFCRIARGDVPADVVHEEDDLLAFHDMNPQAPTHVLVIPREHVASVNDLEPKHDALMGRLVRAARSVAREEGIGDDGYRLVLNTGAEAGQSVFHVHLHVLGGRAMTWPPG